MNSRWNSRRAIWECCYCYRGYFQDLLWRFSSAPHLFQVCMRVRVLTKSTGLTSAYNTQIPLCTFAASLPPPIAPILTVFYACSSVIPPLIFKYCQINDTNLRKKFGDAGNQQTLHMRVALKRNVEATTMLYETCLLQVRAC